MERRSHEQSFVEQDRINGDRRMDRRYRIELDLTYKLIRRRRVLATGIGHTIDLSSGGILFEADRPLPPGLNVELHITWPFRLHNSLPMELLVTGRILRNENRNIAIRTIQHDIRVIAQEERADPIGSQGKMSGKVTPPQFIAAQKQAMGVMKLL